jgi:hypothetical protein
MQQMLPKLHSGIAAQLLVRLEMEALFSQADTAAANYAVFLLSLTSPEQQQQQQVRGACSSL